MIPKAPSTRDFFQIVQSKIHFAITGHTAAELITKHAVATKPNMGVTSFKGAIIRLRDVSVEKNYLNKDELDELNRIVRMWPDKEDMQSPDQILDFQLSARGLAISPQYEGDMAQDQRFLIIKILNQISCT